MDRRNFLKNTALAAGSLALPNTNLFAQNQMLNNLPFTKADFGADFKWGVATAAYQIEGAWDADGKGLSIWDTFTHKNGGKKIKTGENGNVACNFYSSFRSDLDILKSLNMDVFRFSTAWSRILPNGTGKVNQKGLDFYKQVVDYSLEKGISPWITLYHWDLPQALQDKGGWANRDILNWFSEYSEVVTRALGDRVKDWMVLNEPMAFTGLGYLIGWHAPGLMAPNKFLASVHHSCLSMGNAGRIIRNNVKDANVGTTFSCSYVSPHEDKPINKGAAHRLNILLNRLYVEPILGMPYPEEDFAFISGIHKHIKGDDMQKMPFDFDFIGIQNYTQVKAKKSIMPIVWANEVKPHKRGVPPENITEMGWEVYPEGLYKILKQFSEYKNLPRIIVTENGAAFPDKVENNQVNDVQRVAFFEKYLAEVLRAKRDGMKIDGYFVWTLMDNFEWAEGYKPRFGLVHVDYKTQKRTIKDSGLWFKEFLK
jgi:beta-glucosidase